MSLRRILLLGLGSSCVLGAVILGCSDDDKKTVTDTPDATADSGRVDSGGGGGDDDDDDTVDASKDAGADVVVKDANGPGEAGSECAFNRDCQAALRCECEGFGCECKPGVRGTGQNGITACDSGNDCASSVCLDGPKDSGQLCTDECNLDTDCPPKLPICSDIAGVGRVCIRQP